jgi:putative transposase
MNLRPELIDELLKDYKKPEDLIGDNGIFKQLTKALVERALGAELTHYLGYDKSAAEGKNSGNSRNGTTPKTIKSDYGEIPIETPRDRNGDFEPQLIKKGHRRFTGFDDKILSMYARGMTTRDIQSHLKEIYNVDISADLVSTVTSEIMDEVKEWQNRSLDEQYAIVYFDAIWVKVREEGHVINKAAYLAIGVRLTGHKDVLGIWIEKEEGAKFWLRVMSELKQRGLQDILIACIDGLKGFPDAIETVFPKTQVQLCIVHRVRNSLKFVSYKDRKKIAADLKTVYQAPNETQAKDALCKVNEKWGKQYPLLTKSWFSNWDRVIPFFNYPEDIRRSIYTTNAIESLNNALRKVTKNRGAFPNDEAVMKLFYMALKNIMKKWTMQLQNWSNTINQLSIIFGDRIMLER